MREKKFKSKNLRVFKKSIGNANHFLITILVGLDSIEKYDIDKNDEFSTSWNPKSKVQSSRRSRTFALKSVMAWIVDNLDMYIRTINEKPKLVSDCVSKKLDADGRSIYNRFLTLSSEYSIDDTIEHAMVDLLICWRNRLVHFKADNNISENSKTILLKQCDKISDDYSGLSVVECIESFEHSKSPRFKEVAALIRAAHQYVYMLDEKLYFQIDKEKYLFDNVGLFFDNDDKKIDSVYSNDVKTRFRKLSNIAHECGLSVQNGTISEDLIVKLSQMDHSLARKTFKKTMMSQVEMK